MKKLVALDKDYNIKLKSTITNFLNPNFIYIPFREDKNFNQNAKVKKGEELFLHVYSPISGEIVGMKKCLLSDGLTKKCLVIHNDFKESKASNEATRRKMTNITKEEFLSSILNVKLKNTLNHFDINEIIVSGIDDEPYIANEVFIGKENTKIILETLDALLDIYNINKASIILKNIDGENISSYNDYLGTYKNISLKLVDDLYLIGKEKNLIEHLRIKDSYLYLKTSEIYDIYNYLKKRKPVVEKIITITGNAINTPQVFQVKLGTNVKEILLNFYDESVINNDIYVNGIMEGKILNIDELIVDDNFLGLVIMKKQEIKSKECIKCGKCISICPIGSNPLIAYKNGKKVPCINCGLCSYICPSYINLRKYLTGEKDE